MTNPERHPGLITCHADPSTGIEVLVPREVPLGGPRAMLVRRTLPQRERSLIGAWCFVDHYGPDRVAETGGMSVAPHPHTGLQTVSWLFTGEIEHRDSIGNRAMVRPREINLMTAGQGISHTEVSTSESDLLHGAQLWVALPESARDTAPAFAHHAPSTIEGPGWQGEVFLGSLLGDRSPVATFTPLVGAELRLTGERELVVDVEATFEHGLLIDSGRLEADGVTLAAGELGYLPPGRARITLRALDGPVRLLVLGGEPFGESIVMWWNFVGRSHEEIVAFRRQWQEQVAAGGAQGRFGVVDSPLSWLPAPELPNARLRDRR